MRTIASVLVAGLVVATATSASGGSITFTSDAYPDRVVLHVTIVDDGGAADCEQFWIMGTASFLDFKFPIPRTPGTSTYEFVDSSVLPNKVYRYNLQGYYGVIFPSDPIAFANAFGDDWHAGFYTWANVGPGPIPIAKGQLSSHAGDVWSGNIGLIYCNSDQSLGTIGVALPAAAEHFIDSGEDVQVYGRMFRVGPQFGDGILVDLVLPAHCPPTAVEPAVWSQVKRLYR